MSVYTASWMHHSEHQYVHCFRAVFVQVLRVMLSTSGVHGSRVDMHAVSLSVGTPRIGVPSLSDTEGMSPSRVGVLDVILLRRTCYAQGRKGLVYPAELGYTVHFLPCSACSMHCEGDATHHPQVYILRLSS